MNNRGYALIKALLVAPAAICAFLIGFIATDLSRGDALSANVALNELGEKIKGGFTKPAQAELSPLRAFEDALATVQKHAYKEPPASEELTYSAIRGMLAVLKDPYTRFMDPKEFSRMMEDTRGDFVGIGAELRDAPEGAKVQRPLPNSPALAAGIKKGDVIVAVDGKKLDNTALDDIVRQIRGQRNTKVVLTIKRDGEPAPLTFEIVRNVIVSPTVDLYEDDPENKLFTIHLQNFNEKAANLLDRAMSEAEQKGMKGFILDLRYDLGGLLDSAVEVTSRFLEKGTVVIVQGKNGAQEKKAVIPGRFKARVPFVVLVNGGSASASEILTGAIQDHGKAPIIGETTFGKGLVQTVISLQNTAVAITTAKYLTPNGTDINPKLENNERVGGGIKPDIEVKMPEDYDGTEREDDPQLKRALEILRERVEKANR